MTNRVTTIIRHDGAKDSGSFEVRFLGGRPTKFFYWDDDPSRRLRPDMLTGGQALRQARAFAKTERTRIPDEVRRYRPTQRSWAAVRSRRRPRLQPCFWQDLRSARDCRA